jgi:hypothetical protein
MHISRAAGPLPALPRGGQPCPLPFADIQAGGHLRKMQPESDYPKRKGRVESGNSAAIVQWMDFRVETVLM